MPPVTPKQSTISTDSCEIVLRQSVLCTLGSHDVLLTPLGVTKIEVGTILTRMGMRISIMNLIMTIMGMIMTIMRMIMNTM